MPRKTIWEIYPLMAEIIPEGEIGEAKVKHHQVTDFQLLRAAVQRQMSTDQSKTYAQLLVNNYLVMSDTEMERYSNLDFYYEATGRVLVAGLGLGMIIHAAASKPEVTEIVVIEKSADVIALIEPTLPNNGTRIHVVEADILEWRPPKGETFDTMYFDIWANICTDNLDDMKRLHNAFKFRRRTKQSWMSSWYKEELWDMRRSGW
jgi:predicted membrane-bound spermidine synthase